MSPQDNDPDLVRDHDDAVTADTPASAAEAAPEPTAGEATPVTTAAEATPVAAEPFVPVPDPAGSGTVEAGPPSAASRPGRFGGRWIERGVATALVLASAGVAVHFYLQDRDRRLIDEAHQSAQDAACAYAPLLATYDAKTFQGYVAKALASATGEFKNQFADASKSLGDVMSSADVSSKGSDANCELKSGDRGSAQVAVVVNQTIVAAGTQGKPVNGQLSMVMSLARTNGKWLVDAVKIPQQNGQ